MKKLKKIQTLDLSFFIRKNCFSDYELQNDLISQPVFKFFQTSAGAIFKIFTWKSKGSLGKCITAPATSDNKLFYI